MNRLLKTTEILLMSDTLQKQTEEFFDRGINLTKTYPGLRGLQRKIERCRKQLSEPMRVAIVGKIKTGKSTIMNSLLGEYLVTTGQVEATFNVNWLKYGEKPALIVHFKDDARSPETRTLAELELLTLRAEENQEFLLSISYIEVFYSNPMLPKLHGQEITAQTQKQAAGADAILYLFRQSAGETDEQVMREFQGAAVGRATPLNAIAVLTRVDDYWHYRDRPDPLLAGKEVAQKLLEDHPRLNCLFYTIYPACGLLGLGSQNLTNQEWEILNKLAVLPQERLSSLMNSARRFSEKDYVEESEIPIASERAKVASRLGLYGVSLACDYLRSQENIDRHTLAQKLLEQSGVSDLRKLIISHFGNRAFLIKLNTCTQQLKKILFEEERKQTGQEQKIVREITGWLDKLESQELFFHQVRELEILRSYYDNKLNFTAEEIEQLLQVTGERGTSCTARLGLPPQTTIVQMLDEANKKLQYWLIKASYIDPNAESIKATHVLVQSYERLLYHLNEAYRYLNYSDRQNNNDQNLLANQLSKCNTIPPLLKLGNRLQNLISSQTNNRIFLIEFTEILKQIKQIYYSERANNHGSVSKQVAEIAAIVDKIEANEHAPRELNVLQDYEAGKLDFSHDELEQLLEVTGEKGTSLNKRLGLAEDVAIAQLLARVNERVNYWIIRSNDPLGANFYTIRSAQILLQSYERLKFQIEQANMHLEIYSNSRLN
jgi:hypothetical protein